MYTHSVTPGTVRWAGILIVAYGLLAVGAGMSSDQPGMAALVAACVAAAGAAAVLLPWRRWHHAVALAQAVASLSLLVVAEVATQASDSRQAAATYPVFVTLVLAWVGLTQPRRTALSFTVCVGAVLAGVLLYDSGGPLDVPTLALILPAGAALGEAASWIMGELRRLQRHDEARATTFIDLTRSLDALPQRASRAEVADELASAAARLFDTSAEVTLIDVDGHDMVAVAGRHPGPVHPGAGPGPADGTAAASDHVAGAAAVGTVLTASRPKRTTVTLVGRRGILGRVQLELDRDPDDGYLTNLVRLFAAQSSAALERFELVTRLDHEVSHDVLTGTGNRRHANKLLSTLRNGDGIVLIDIDGFKAVNDTAGHLAGDELLRTLGRYLNSYVRGGDDVARLGGDEFVVLARGVGHAATAAANRLIEGWRALNPTATVSIGVAVHHGGENPESTLERADQALYGAKRAGRNQIGVSAVETDRFL
ncbi:MAG: GGDEF domain-containing protein [Acidimicrobiales bacterium]|nr:GGDEF domain-containing protein [Acidimicrobiales bacterium]